MLKNKKARGNIILFVLANIFLLFSPFLTQSANADHLNATGPPDSMVFGPTEGSIVATFGGTNVVFTPDANGVYNADNNDKQTIDASCPMQIRDVQLNATPGEPAQGTFVTYSDGDHFPQSPCTENETFSVTIGAEQLGNPGDDAEGGAAEETVPTCEAQGGSTGWLACPLIEGMLGAMVGITNFMSELLNLRPISATANDPIFVVWGSVRNIALAILVIAVLIAIFGQTVGVDAYTVKKMIPRIGVAVLAILLSFYISAILIDFFNVLGNGMQALMFSTLDDTPISVGLGSQWAAGILAGIGAGGALVLLLNPATLATLGLILMPVLLAFLTAIAVVILRQVVIIGLVIASPLAFALWILPNTEKWFKRWYGMFSTMLMMYPIIMVLLGAGAMYAVIITNNGSLNSGEGITSSNFANYLLAIAGIGVSMAAVPFTLRASSGILRGITGAINNPNRGIFDKARKGMQGVRERNMDQRRQDRLAGLRDGKTTSGKDFKKISPTRALYRASTGTMGKFTGGGKYAELNREQKEAEARTAEQQMAKANTAKLRIPLEDKQIELEAGRIDIQLKGLEDKARTERIQSVMSGYASPRPDPSRPGEMLPPVSPGQLLDIARGHDASGNPTMIDGKPVEDVDRIAATLRLTQMRQDKSMGEALASMPGWMASETVNRDFGTFSEFSPHLTAYASGQSVSESDLAQKVMSKGYHQVGGMGPEAIQTVNATGNTADITQLANRYIEAYDKNQQLSPEGVKTLHAVISTNTNVPEAVRNRVEQIALGTTTSTSSNTTNSNTSTTNTNTTNTTNTQQVGPTQQQSSSQQPPTPPTNTLYIANPQGRVTGELNVPRQVDAEAASDQDNTPPPNPPS